MIINNNKEKLNSLLETFGVKATVDNVTEGARVTRYELRLDPSQKLNAVTKLAGDIGVAFGVAPVVRVEPVFGKDYIVGVEIPNKESKNVYLGEIILSGGFQSADSKTTFILGKNIDGEVIINDMAEMPHLLIAGTTGSGKSVFLNSLIVSMLCKASAEDLRFIMIDPKQVELTLYNGIPHLLMPVITDTKIAARALVWAAEEMDRRYKLLEENRTRSIEGYNAKTGEKLPKIVVIIDELAEFLMTSGGTTETTIIRIAQKGRAAGIHLVIATQRPDKDVVTGLIKANIPSRIAFTVSSAINSRIILDEGGAEKLLGKGDMLFKPVGAMKPERIQGAFISEDEIEKIIDTLITKDL